MRAEDTCQECNKRVCQCRWEAGEFHTVPMDERIIMMRAEDGKIKSLVESIPSDVILQVGDVMAWAAESGKYKEDSWITNPTTPKKRIGSGLRHIYKLQMGQEVDDESKLPHLAHAITQLIMAQHYINKGIK